MKQIYDLRTVLHSRLDDVREFSKVYESIYFKCQETTYFIADLKNAIAAHVRRVSNKRKIEFHHVLLALCEAIQARMSILFPSLSSQDNTNEAMFYAARKMDHIPSQAASQAWKPIFERVACELLITYCSFQSYQITDDIKDTTLLDTVAGSMRKILGRPSKSISTTYSYFIGLKENLYAFHLRISQLLSLEVKYREFLDLGAEPMHLLSRKTTPLADLSALVSNHQRLIGVFNAPLEDATYVSWLNTTYPSRVLSPNEFEFCFDVPTTLNDSFRMTVLGCHGMDGSFFAAMKDQYLNPHPDAQLAVARLLREAEPDMNLQLGDNVYYDGIPFITDTDKLKYFQHNQELYGYTASFKPIPNWVLPGNHDYGFWGRARLTEKLDFELKAQTHLRRIFNQVFHTFVKNDHWNMPHRYYLLMHKHFCLFMLDTNMLIFDRTQQKWFVDTLLEVKQRHPKMWIIVAGHHPLFYLDKAEYKCEWYTYYRLMEERGQPAGQLGLYEKSRNSFIKIEEPDANGCHELNHMGKFLAKLIQTNQLPIDLWLCAHEHIMAKIKATFDFTSPGQFSRHTLCQLTCGGGGAKIRSIQYNPNTIEFAQGYRHVGVIDVKSDFNDSVHGFAELEICAEQLSWRPVLVWKRKQMFEQARMEQILIRSPLSD